MDGIKILGTEYMVIGDGLTGLPIGMVPSIKSVDVRACVPGTASRTSNCSA